MIPIKFITISIVLFIISTRGFSQENAFSVEYSNYITTIENHLNKVIRERDVYYQLLDEFVEKAKNQDTLGNSTHSDINSLKSLKDSMLITVQASIDSVNKLPDLDLIVNCKYRAEYLLTLIKADLIKASRLTLNVLSNKDTAYFRDMLGAYRVHLSRSQFVNYKFEEIDACLNAFAKKHKTKD